jgi:hypothetical protein
VEESYKIDLLEGGPHGIGGQNPRHAAGGTHVEGCSTLEDPAQWHHRCLASLKNRLMVRILNSNLNNKISLPVISLHVGSENQPVCVLSVWDEEFIVVQRIETCHMHTFVTLIIISSVKQFLRLEKL